MPPADDDAPAPAPAPEPAKVSDKVEFEDPEPVLATVEVPPPLPDGVTPISERRRLPGVPRPRKEAEPGSVSPLRKRPPRDRPR
jgi:hypothetical protein